MGIIQHSPPEGKREIVLKCSVMCVLCTYSVSIGVESSMNAVMVARHFGASVALALYNGVTGSFIVESFQG